MAQTLPPTRVTQRYRKYLWKENIDQAQLYSLIEREPDDPSGLVEYEDGSVFTTNEIVHMWTKNNKTFKVPPFCGLGTFDF